MLFAALFNAVCLHNAYFFAIDFANSFLLLTNTLSWITDTVCIFQILFCIIHSAFNLLVFLINQSID